MVFINAEREGGERFTGKSVIKRIESENKRKMKCRCESNPCKHTYIHLSVRALLDILIRFEFEIFNVTRINL